MQAARRDWGSGPGNQHRFSCENSRRNRFGLGKKVLLADQLSPLTFAEHTDHPVNPVTARLTNNLAFPHPFNCLCQKPQALA